MPDEDATALDMAGRDWSDDPLVMSVHLLHGFERVKALGHF
jgi:hypothetical protein